jgi:putative FmdB family regulatory protein
MATKNSVRRARSVIGERQLGEALLLFQVSTSCRPNLEQPGGFLTAAGSYNRVMPTYEYACQSCGRHLEVHQRFSDEALTVCSVCGGPLRKVFHPAGILFKGSGFYATDSRSGSRGGTKDAGSQRGDGAKTGGDAGKTGGDAGGTAETKKDVTPPPAKKESA